MLSVPVIGPRRSSPSRQFPPLLNIPSNTPSKDKEVASMNFHNPRKLSPAPHSDDLESDFGAEVRDIPIYRPSQTYDRREMRDRPSTPRTHELDALVSDIRASQRPQGRSETPERPFSRKATNPETFNSPRLPSYHPERPPPDLPENSHLEQEQRRMHGTIPSSLSSPTTAATRSISVAGSDRESYYTNATSLPALQQKGVDDQDQLEPLTEEDIDPGCFDLVAPPEGASRQYSLETRSEQLFSTDHLQVIFADPSLLLRFTAFLSACKPSSIPILIYYLDAIKALKALSYSNAIAEALDPLPGFDFTTTTASKTVNLDLEEKSKQAFEAMVRGDLPAYITHTYVQTVSLSIQRRITGTLPSHLREASEGLAEVFCLTDPSRPDNPIVFASEEFHRTTQYGMSYVLGKNCRFLQGPKTNPFSVRRIREKLEAGVEHCEVFLNYRRDGSPFMNLLMCAPLCDSRGVIRYHIGAQVDVSGLVKECSDLESLRRLTIQKELAANGDVQIPDLEMLALKDEFQELSEMLNLSELDTVRKWGGRMHKESQEDNTDNNYNNGNWARNRVLISSSSPDGPREYSQYRQTSGRLSGIYENYLLVRPYPSLKILFASPSLRVPGILQSPFMAKIGGSNRVREELTQAFADGRGVTAKIKWVSKADLEGRSRWIHATPLIGSNGAIGVWMVVIMDDETHTPHSKKFKMAPPIDPKFGRNNSIPHKDDASLREFAIMHGGRENSKEGSVRQGSLKSHGGSDRSASPYSLRIE